MGDSVIYPHMMQTKQAAQTFGISAMYLRKLCKQGKVRYVKIAENRWLINCDSLAAYFNQGDNCPAEQPETVVGIRRVAP